MLQYYKLLRASRSAGHNSLMCAWQAEKHAFFHLFYYEVFVTRIELMVLMWLVCCFLVKILQIQFPIAFLWVMYFFEHEKEICDKLSRKDQYEVYSGQKTRSVQSENLKKLANFFKL